MEKDFYRIANQIDSSSEAAICAQEMLDDRTRQKYRHDVLKAVHQEKSRRRRKRIAAAAACIAVMAAGMAVFHDEVYAAMEQIHMSLGAALGLESDYAARYTKAMHTSASSGGYTITLDEAIAAPGKLYAIFFIEREDGGQMQNIFHLQEQLSINGEPVSGGNGIGYGFVDEHRRMIRAVAEYSLSGRELSGENFFELKLTSEDHKAASWEFQFRADSSEIYQDTKVMELGLEYSLTDGTKLVLDEMILNKMGQQITFHLSENGSFHEIQLQTVDEQGRETLFRLASFNQDHGYLENSFIVGNDGPVKSWIAQEAKKLEVTVYAMDGPEEDGMSEEDDRTQIGETAVWDLAELERMGE